MRFLIILILIFVSSCTSLPLYVPPNMDASVSTAVIIYRTPKFRGSAASPKIYLNEHYIGVLDSGTYVKTKVIPGRYDLTVGKKENDYANWAPENVVETVDLLPGTTRYFRFDLNYDDSSLLFIPIGTTIAPLTMGKIGTALEEVDGVKALEELKTMRPKKNRRN